MSQQAVLDALDATIERLQRIRADVKAGAYQWMRDGWNGHPRSPSLDPGSGRPAPPDSLPDELRGSLGYNDPTGAVVAATNARDAAHRDAKQTTRDIVDLDTRSRRVVERFDRYRPRNPSLFDQQQTEDPEPGCVSCARVRGPGGTATWWNEATRTTTLASGSKVDLCNACYESVEVGARWTGSLPPKDWVEFLRDHGKPRKRSA